MRARAAPVALVVYVALSVLYFGVPLGLHPGRDLVGNGADPEIFVWSLGWWPHAVLHGQNPIVTHAVWAPVGENLAWTTSIPGLALLLSPVTLAFGPAVSYNVMAVLIPAADAFTAFLLCRHLTRRFWPSLAGGYLFGFSSYVLGQTEGHPHMTSVFLVPVVVLVVLRRLEGTLSTPRFAVLLGVLLAFQFAFSTELFFTVSVALVVCLVIAVAVRPAVRRLVRPLAAGVVGAYVLACVLVSPLLAYALLHFQHGSINEPGLFPGDLANLVVPTPLTWLNVAWSRHVSAMFQGNTAENGGYVGLPALAIVGWYAWEGRRRGITWLVVGLAALAELVELGDSLHFRGKDLVALPWAHIATLPGFDNVLPARFAMFVALAVAVIVALWASRSRAPAFVRGALVALAVVFVVPHVWLSVWHEHPQRPAFFAAGTDKTCFSPSDNVLVLPYPSLDDAMLWQAEAGYRFRMADGNLSPLVPRTLPMRLYAQDLVSGYRPSTDRGLLQVARTQGVTAILVPGDREDWLKPFGGAQPESLGGVYLYGVGPNASPCAPSRLGSTP